jgi:gliding motility-associated-like protein
MSKYLLVIVLLLSSSLKAQEPATTTPLVSQNFKSDEQGALINGYASILQNNKFSFVNQEGKLIGTAEYDGVRNFSNHLAAGKKNNQWGFINEKGKIVIPIEYDIIYDFKDDITAGYKNNQWLLINKKGVTIKILDIDVFWGFENGIARITKQGRTGIMNLNGEIISMQEEKKTFSSNFNSDTVKFSSIQSALPCPPNIDFEFNNFTNWVCYSGGVAAVGTTNRITVTPNVPPTTPTIGRHVIFPRVTPSALDPWGLFPTNPPDGSNYALKLGNASSGRQAESVSYLINIPAGPGDASVTYRYAVIFQNPGDHLQHEQPRFIARLKDVSTNTYINCASYEYVSNGNIPGFYNSPINPDVKCKAWTSAFVNLSAYAGKTMMLEFTTADCTRGIHWGYAYVDVGDCNIAASIDYSCTPSTATLTAPPGFEFYNWWNANYTTLLGTGQSTILTPAPPLNTTIHVEVIPLNGTGCKDTLDVMVTNNNPAVNAGPDKMICAGNSTPIGTPAIAGVTYSWSPPAYLSNPNSATPNANPPVTTKYYLTATNGTIGCSNIDSVIVTVDQAPDVVQPANQTPCANTNTTTITFTGAVNGTVYNWTNSNPAIGLPANGTGNINSFIAVNTTDVPITSIITVTPTANGCLGAPKTFSITVNPTPNVAKPADEIICVNGNTAPINFNGTVSGTVYNWSNNNPAIGLAASGTGNINSFVAINTTSSPITATITVTPNAGNCLGAAKTFSITVNPTPNITPVVNQALCANSNTAAITFNGTVSGTVYNWSNNNPAIGLAASGAGNINSFIAINNTASPITSTVTVAPTVTNGCPGAQIKFDIIVHPIPNVNAGSNRNVCLGKTTPLLATGAVNYSWTPGVNLSCVNCPNPDATPVDSIMYIVKGSSLFGCFAYDSVILTVSKPFKMPASPNDTLCIGETASLWASNANNYLWSPPDGLNNIYLASPKAKPASTTKYQVVGYDDKNCFTDTNYVLITVGPYPKVNLGPDKTLSTGTILNLNAVTQFGPIVNWLWYPATDLSCNNCPSPTTSVKYNTFYSVIVTNIFGCQALDTIFINSFCKSGQVFIPNAFTPDGDGLNDVLMVRGIGIRVKSFRIFNRWGERVFEKQNFGPNEIKFGWDGKVRGVLAAPDVFVYTAEVICDNDVIFTYKGNTTILK